MSLACPLVLCFPSLGGTLGARGSIRVHAAVVAMGGKKKKKKLLIVSLNGFLKADGAFYNQ